MKSHKLFANIVLGAASLFALMPLSALHAEELAVGSTSTGVPFTFLNVKTRKIDGMMVDLIHKVGDEAGFTPDVRAVDFASLIPALQSGRIDIISAAMLKTPKRAKVIDFSDPVYPYGEGLVVPEDDNSTYSQSLTGTKGKVIGVEAGTTYLNGLRQMDGIGKIRVYDSLANMMHDIKLGRIQAGLGDKPILAYQMSQGKYEGIKFANGYKSQFTGSIAIGVRKGNNALLKRINDALVTLKKNGEINKLAEKWGLK